MDIYFWFFHKLLCDNKYINNFWVIYTFMLLTRDEIGVCVIYHVVLTMMLLNARNILVSSQMQLPRNIT